MNHTANDGRSMAEILSDMKEELKEFLQTRIALLREEIQEKLQRLKAAAPLAGAAIVFLSTAYLLITIAMVALISVFFAASPYHWFFGFIIVGVVWGLWGIVAAYIAKRELELKTLVPRRTIEVLKDDKAWLQNEVKT